MTKFLKKNLLLILVLFFGYAAAALAGTYARPNGSTQYVGGAKAVGAAVDADFNSLVAWINGANISSANVGAQALLASNTANLGLAVTSSSSAFSMSGVTPVAVTNLSAIIVTSGRAVRISLEPVPATYISSGVVNYGSFVQLNGSNMGANIFFVNNGATTAFIPIASSAGAALNTAYFNCTDFQYTEPSLAAGTYTFSVKASANSTTFLAVNNCRLVVKEEF